MPALAAFAERRLAALAEAGLTRTPRAFERMDDLRLRRGGRELISFSCNDYLGLAQHPDVLAAARSASAAGSAASRLVTGSLPKHEALEAKLAAWKGYAAGTLFGSGMLAGLGVIPALAGRGDLVLLDRLSHASLIDGARLSGATLRRFAHNDIESLACLLANERPAHRHCLIVTETVFSMDGDRAPLARLSELARAHDGWLLADDAHGLGEALPVRPDILLGTLSKALGAYGGYALADAATIGLLQASARSFLFSTALPPSAAAAASMALDLLQTEPARREKAFAHAREFCAQLGLPAPASQIVPLIFGAPEAAVDASARLEDAGFLAVAIRPPTVPAGASRLRFTFSTGHESRDIARLADAIRSLPASMAA